MLFDILESWIGGVSAKGVQRYVWESFSTSLDPSYLPYNESIAENTEYFLTFYKMRNASYLRNSHPSLRQTGVLCETSPD